MQTPALHAAAADSIRAAALHAQALADSAKLARLSAHVDSQYVQFLEKTNAGLSTWWTAAGVLLAAVGVLVAVGAVLGAVLMYRQSREFKQTLAEAVRRYQVVLNGFIDEKRQEIAAEIASVKQEIEDADGERRQELEAIAVRLERQQKTLARSDAKRLEAFEFDREEMLRLRSRGMLVCEECGKVYTPAEAEGLRGCTNCGWPVR